MKTSSACQLFSEFLAMGKKPTGFHVYSYSVCCLKRFRKKWAFSLSCVYHSVVNDAKVIYNLQMQMELEK